MISLHNLLSETRSLMHGPAIKVYEWTSCINSLMFHTEHTFSKWRPTLADGTNPSCNQINAFTSFGLGFDSMKALTYSLKSAVFAYKGSEETCPYFSWVCQQCFHGLANSAPL